MTGALWELFFQGVWITVQLMVYSAALAAAVAFGIGMARTSRFWIVRFLSGTYMEIFRGTSALVLMFWLFFALPLLGWQLAGVWAGTLALGLSYGAYGSEVVRGALQAVAPAQREAAIALSFSPWQRMRKVILPQAVPEMLPPFNNLLIELLKCTALASLLSIGELTFQAKLARLSTGQSAQVYGIILVLYFVIAFAVTRIMRLLERRAKASVGRAPEPSAGRLFRKPSAAGREALTTGGGRP
ncbi:ectoine/hydroxyectoine ABC transporter permease subunit EhuC [Streptomyces pinistramenti]|uniref:ectoine/hydroxyectoine ABC transporter permease subunit EhuC n=1 Tax=Streptomyces pinistramenti TaxID=2884812 RepID=UPI001D086361|nr:ectoine/hydroxyectoine ABC transporter permease subunit EhuC [Streptomyces pinistramenti]MCB5910305.1 ectoine/hydroxyectoine ABC transporter permease subunit EhuC [Streptomyces pinistramenti]